jgi:TRAP-type C4-dicarboxylate transport system permease small subunit
MNVLHTAKMAEKGIRAIENFFGNIASLMLFLMMCIGAFDVIGRYVFNNPILGASEVSTLLMGGMVFLGWAHTQEKMSHVTVDILFILYPPRVQHILSFVMLFVVFILFAVITWEAALLAVSDWKEGMLMSILQIPVAPFKALISLGALLLCFECMIQMVHIAWARWRGKAK